MTYVPLSSRAILPSVKSIYVPSQNFGMVGLRGVLHHSILLADGASTRAPLAYTRAFTVSGAGSGLDHDVDRCGLPHGPMAAHEPVRHALELGARPCPIPAGILHLLTSRSAFQLGAAWRPA